MLSYPILKLSLQIFFYQLGLVFDRNQVCKQKVSSKIHPFGEYRPSIILCHYGQNHQRCSPKDKGFAPLVAPVTVGYAPRTKALVSIPRFIPAPCNFTSSICPFSHLSIQPLVHPSICPFSHVSIQPIVHSAICLFSHSTSSINSIQSPIVCKSLVSITTNQAPLSFPWICLHWLPIHTSI